MFVFRVKALIFIIMFSTFLVFMVPISVSMVFFPLAVFLAHDRKFDE